MKRLKTILAITAVTFSSALFANSLTITVTGYEQQPGTTMLEVHNNADHYANGNPPLASVMLSINSAQSTAKVTFHDLSPGDYAVRLFHDENGNKQMDSNVLGIPTESYGFSNNAGSFGPASFDDAKVTVANATTTQINLK